MYISLLNVAKSVCIFEEVFPNTTMTPAKVYKRLGGEQLASLPKVVQTGSDLANLVSHGLPKQAIKTLADSLGVEEKEIIGLLPVTARNLQRYKNTDKLSETVADRLVTLASLFEWGEHVLGKDYFNEWLHTSSLPLGDKPVTLLTSNTGVQAVKDELTRIAFGVLA